MNCGKTRFIHKYLSKHLTPLKRTCDLLDTKEYLNTCVYISTRKSFTDKVTNDFKEFGFVKYNDDELYDRPIPINMDNTDYTCVYCYKCKRAILPEGKCSLTDNDFIHKKQGQTTKLLKRDVQLRLVCQIESIKRVT